MLNLWEDTDLIIFYPKDFILSEKSKNNMNKMMKIVSVVAAGLLMAQCSATYKMKSEKGKVLNQNTNRCILDRSSKKTVFKKIISF